MKMDQHLFTLEASEGDSTIVARFPLGARDHDIPRTLNVTKEDNQMNHTRSRDLVERDLKMELKYLWNPATLEP